MRFKIVDFDFKVYGLNVIENFFVVVNDFVYFLFGKCKLVLDNYEGLRVCVDEGDGR